MSIEAMQQALEALITAEAGLADIGDADREPGDDLAWCEARAAQALSAPRSAITSLRQAIARVEQHEKQEPVLVVEKEPDYMSGGHFHTGTKPHIDPTKVWSLPIGTKLYTHPYTSQPKRQS